MVLGDSMKHVRLLLGAAALIACTGSGWFSIKDEPPQKQILNFSGELYNLRGGKQEVENISIGNRLHTIKMYEVPLDTTCDPTDDVTIFDLSMIHAIEPAHQGKCKDRPAWQMIKNKEYIEIVVTLNDREKTKNHYLIWAKDKIICDRVTGAGPIPKEVSFSAIKKLIINDNPTERISSIKNKDS